MQFSFFEKQLDRLRRVYSSTSLNEERAQVLWQRFKHVPEAQFDGAISYLIGEFTTQALPGVSRFEEAVARFKQQQPRKPGEFSETPIVYKCEPCRDWGFGWIGDTIVRCTCAMGATLSDQEIARQQGNYDRGKKFMPSIIAMIRKGQSA